jgi:predicted nucleic acid-binding protein
VIYLDTSVALAHLLAEDRAPPDELWRETLVSSRLLEYEIWTRIHAGNLAATHAQAAQALLSRVAFLELIGEVLDRARAPFPTPVRTLDALHLASLRFLREQGQPIRLATYDRRMVDAAVKASVPLFPL